MVTAILRKEILGSGRQGRYFLVRGAYLAVLACLALPALFREVRDATSGSLALMSLSSRGREFALFFGVIQVALVALIAPAVSVGAIAQERESGALDLLHAAGVGAGAVIAGKASARMAWLAVFLVSGLPLFFAGTIMGGVGLASIGLLFWTSLLAAAVGTGLGLAISGGVRQTVPALVLAYICMLGIYLLPPVVTLFLEKLQFLGGASTGRWEMWSSPLIATGMQIDGSVTALQALETTAPQLFLSLLLALPAWQAVRSTRSRLPGSHWRTAAGLIVLSLLCAELTGLMVGFLEAPGHPLPRFFAWVAPATAWIRPWPPRYVLEGVGIHFALLLTALAFLLRARRERLLEAEETVRADQARLEPAAVGPSAGAAEPDRSGWPEKIRGNPVAWRDARGARRALPARILRWVYLGLATVMLGGSLLATAGARHGQDDVARISLFLLVAGGGLVALIAGSGALAEERERRSMQLLVLTRLSAGELIGGKVWGLIVYLWPMATIPILAAALLFQERDPWALLVASAMTFSVLWAGLAVGMLFSSFARRPATSAAMAIGSAAAYSLIPLLFLLFGFEREVRNLVEVTNPLVSVAILLDHIGKTSGWSAEGEAGRALAGLVFLTVLGAVAMLLSRESLRLREEG